MIADMAQQAAKKDPDPEKKVQFTSMRFSTGVYDLLLTTAKACGKSREDLIELLLYQHTEEALAVSDAERKALRKKLRRMLRDRPGNGKN